MFNVFEGLVKPDSSGNYVNAVASDVSISEDGLTYTFTLRDGVVFHNGETCTTEDVLYSFETCAATSWTSAVVEALSAVTDLRAEGNQVIVTLNAPNPDFLSYVSSVSIVPAGYDQQATQPVGTGPFKFVSRSVQENIILERHEDYYGTPAYLDRVTYRIYEDSNALFTALNSGALDLVAHLTSDQVSNLTNGYEVLEGTMNLVQALYLNHAVEPSTMCGCGRPCATRWMWTPCWPSPPAATAPRWAPPCTRPSPSTSTPAWPTPIPTMWKRPKRSWPRRAIPTGSPSPSPCPATTSPMWTRRRCWWSSSPGGHHGPDRPGGLEHLAGGCIREPKL